MFASRKSVQALEDKLEALEAELKEMRGILYPNPVSTNGSTNGSANGTRRRKLSPERAAYYFEVSEQEILHLAASGKVPYVLREVDGSLVPFFSGVDLREVLGKEPNHGRPKG